METRYLMMQALCQIFPYAMTGFTLIVVTIFSYIFMASNSINDVRVWLALGLTDCFIVACMSTIAVIIGIANKTMVIEAGLAKCLAGVTVAEIAGLVTIVVKFYFDKSENKYRVQSKT